MNQIFKKKLTKLFLNYVEAATPEICLKKIKSIKNNGKILIIGVGKASIPYCEHILPKIKSRFEGIIISTKIKNIPKNLKDFKIFFAGHPIPNKNGIIASQFLITQVKKLKENDLLLFVVSGGGSALLPAPPEGFSLKDEIFLNKKIINSGMTIQEINLIRKNFSMIKGGRLARIAYPSKIKTLVVSDIPGDDITQVASGPTLPSNGGASDAINCLNKYKVVLPEKILNHIKSHNNEIPNINDLIFKKNSDILLASAKQSMKSVCKLAKSMNLEAVIISDESQGEAVDVAKKHASYIKDFMKVNNSKNSARKFCFFSGGETSVTIKNDKGKGGRNTEYLLSLAIQFELLKIRSFFAIAADTDGIDGTENNAGAIIDENTLLKIRNKKLSPEVLLLENNSYLAFKKSGDLFVTGPTGTNVNDFRAIIINY